MPKQLGAPPGHQASGTQMLSSHLCSGFLQLKHPPLKVSLATWLYCKRSLRNPENICFSKAGLSIYSRRRSFTPESLINKEQVVGRSTLPVLGLLWLVRRVRESLPMKNRQESHRNPPLKTLARERLKEKAKYKEKSNCGSCCWSLLRDSEILSLKAPHKPFDLLKDLAPPITEDSSVFSATKSQQVFLTEWNGMFCSTLK